jgi:putative PIN family toxin of toxin-antitoxin system
MTNDADASSLRVVLDSNVLVSAFAFPGGTPYQLVQLLLRNEIVVATSPHTLSEVQAVLRGKLGVGDRTVQDALDLLREHCLLVDPAVEAAVSGISPDDNRVLDCAVVGEVQYLVTGDRGILRLGEFEGIEIVSPAEFLGIARAEGG